MIIPIEVNATLKNTQTSNMLAISDLSMTASSTYQNNLHATTKNLRQPNKTIVGLVYVQDYLPHIASSKSFAEIPVGTVILSDKGWPSNAHQLRQLIIQQSIFNLDNNYIFLSNIGSPILLTQETSIEVNYLINAQNTVKFRREVAPVRCPLIGYYSNNHGVFLGYVYASYETELKLLRKKVDDVIKETNFSCKTNSYYFVHSLYYPISRNNESNIVLVDIIQNSCIFIKFDTSFDVINEIRDRPLNIQYKYSSNDDISNMTIVQDQSDSVIVKSTKTKSSAGRRKTLKYKLTFKGTIKKQIMISYVRREAAEHALYLKNALHKCGYSVYLDVHEIQMGSDWQDSLNSAVQNCNFFVPLITQNYGRTQWTNREVKLADVLNKHIIPINFLDFWPPECLAIQFATTQYIPWKPKMSDHNADEVKDKENETKVWDDESIGQVTKMIIEQVEKISKKSETGKVQERSRGPLPSGEPLGSPSSPEGVSSTAQTEKPLIVISAHPGQHAISNAIKATLSSDYEVWCSNDLTEVLTPSSTTKPEYDNDLPNESNLTPIIEENTTLTNFTQAYARKIAENSKQRPKSVPNNDNDMKLEIKKKDLVRVVSYNGEASYLSSISPDKMDRLKGFQEKVHQSSLVVILASSQYYKSRTSEQHVYYCGQRKKTILVQCDKSSAPVWFSKLMSHDLPLNYDNPSFNNELMSKINKMLDPSCKIMDLHEVKIKYLTDCMKQNLPNIETCVYVFGSTELTNPRTIEICKEIGKELADVSNINIVTNGFYGTGDLVAHTFVQERKSNFKESNDSVVHIVPLRDSKNYKQQCRQKTDHTFEKVSYGQTLFLGESIKERDSVLARLLDTSILIEGDENTAHEIEEFIWNDHFVIPVKSTGGAAGGQFTNVPQKIFSCPTGVRESEWQVLSQPDATPEEVAKAVVHVICDLKKAIHEHAVSKNMTNVKKTFSDRPLKKRTAVRKRINIDVNQRSVVEEGHDKQIEPASPEKILPIFPDNESMQSGTPKIGFRERFNKLVKHFTKH